MCQGRGIAQEEKGEAKEECSVLEGRGGGVEGDDVADEAGKGLASREGPDPLALDTPEEAEDGNIGHGDREGLERESGEEVSLFPERPESVWEYFSRKALYIRKRRLVQKGFANRRARKALVWWRIVLVLKSEVWGPR